MNDTFLKELHRITKKNYINDYNKERALMERNREASKERALFLAMVFVVFLIVLAIVFGCKKIAKYRKKVRIRGYADSGATGDGFDLQTHRSVAPAPHFNDYYNHELHNAQHYQNRLEDEEGKKKTEGNAQRARVGRTRKHSKPKPKVHTRHFNDYYNHQIHNAQHYHLRREHNCNKCDDDENTSKKPTYHWKSYTFNSDDNARTYIPGDNRNNGDGDGYDAGGGYDYGERYDDEGGYDSDGGRSYLSCSGRYDNDSGGVGSYDGGAGGNDDGGGYSGGNDGGGGYSGGNDGGGGYSGGDSGGGGGYDGGGGCGGGYD